MCKGLFLISTPDLAFADMMVKIVDVSLGLPVASPIQQPLQSGAVVSILHSVYTSFSKINPLLSIPDTL